MEALVVCACTAAGPARQRTPARAAPSSARNVRNLPTKDIYILSSASGDADSRGTPFPRAGLDLKRRALRRIIPLSGRGLVKCGESTGLSRARQGKSAYSPRLKAQFRESG